MTSTGGFYAQVSVLLTMASAVKITELKSLTREMKNAVDAKMQIQGAHVACAQALWLLGRCCCRQDKKQAKKVIQILSEILEMFLVVLDRCFDVLVKHKDRAAGMGVYTCMYLYVYHTCTYFTLICVYACGCSCLEVGFDLLCSTMCLFPSILHLLDICGLIAHMEIPTTSSSHHARCSDDDTTELWMKRLNSCLNCLLALLQEIRRTSMDPEALSLVVLGKGGPRNVCVLAELVSWTMKRLVDRGLTCILDSPSHRQEKMLALHALSVAHVALTAPKHDWVAENGDINWFQYNKDLADTNKKHAKDNSENLSDETAEKDAADDLPTAENAFSDEFGDWGIDDSALMNIVVDEPTQPAPKPAPRDEYYTPAPPSTRANALVRE